LFEKSALRRIFGRRRDEKTGGGGRENYIMRSFIFFTLLFTKYY
jgi:hypothetical protein